MDRSDTESIVKGSVIIAAAAAVIAAPVVLFNRFGDTGLQAASIITSGLLSLVLIVLYFQQYTVLNRQTQLMKQKYETAISYKHHLTAEDDTLYIEIRNVGRGTIQIMYLKCEIISDTGTLNVKPGHDQLSAVEDGSKSLTGFSELREFKGTIGMALRGEDDEHRDYPFKHISNRLAAEGVETCTVRITLEIFDETEETSTEPEQIQIAEQEVEMGGLQEYEFEKDGETKTLQQYESRSFSEAIRRIPPGGIAPRDSPYIEYEREE